jgi:hypothetical protein
MQIRPAKAGDEAQLAFLLEDQFYDRLGMRREKKVYYVMDV